MSDKIMFEVRTTTTVTIPEEAIYEAIRRYVRAPAGANVRIFGGCDTAYPDGANVTWDTVADPVTPTEGAAS